MVLVRRRLPSPPAPSAAVCAAFGVLDVGAVVEPAGEDSQHWYASAGASAVVLRWDAFEHQPLERVAGWCEAFDRAGCPVPRPRRASEGYVVADGGDWTCWERVSGTHPAADDLSAARAGVLLARLHGASPGPVAADPPPRLWLHLAELAAVADVGLWAASVFAGLDAGHLVVGHMDLHRANLLDVAGTLHAIDWVDAGRVAAAVDVAVCAAYWGVEAGTSGVAAFLRGYGTLPFESDPAEAVAAAAILLGCRAQAYGSSPDRPYGQHAFATVAQRVLERPQRLRAAAS